MAATALESIPPERNTPTGTSLISSLRTDSSKTARSSSQRSSRPAPSESFASPSFGVQ